MLGSRFRLQLILLVALATLAGEVSCAKKGKSMSKSKSMGKKGKSILSGEARVASSPKCKVGKMGKSGSSDSDCDEDAPGTVGQPVAPTGAPIVGPVGQPADSTTTPSAQPTHAPSSIAPTSSSPTTRSPTTQAPTTRSPTTGTTTTTTTTVTAGFQGEVTTDPVTTAFRTTGDTGGGGSGLQDLGTCLVNFYEPHAIQSDRTCGASSGGPAPLITQTVLPSVGFTTQECNTFSITSVSGTASLYITIQPLCRASASDPQRWTICSMFPDPTEILCVALGLDCCEYISELVSPPIPDSSELSCQVYEDGQCATFYGYDGAVPIEYTLELESCSATLPASPTCSTLESGSAASQRTVNQRLAVVGFAALFVGLALLIRRRLRSTPYRTVSQRYSPAGFCGASTDTMKHDTACRKESTGVRSIVATVSTGDKALHCVTEQMQDTNITKAASSSDEGLFPCATETDGLLTYTPKRSHFEQPAGASTALLHPSHADSHSQFLSPAVPGTRHKRRNLPVPPGTRTSGTLATKRVESDKLLMHSSTGRTGI
eukprot:m.665230 g.665230  ORF g.665230 m.665230 type:complete len:545 (+) comp22747_c0_seq31:259-1893(+)